MCATGVASAGFETFQQNALGRAGATRISVLSYLKQSLRWRGLQFACLVLVIAAAKPKPKAPASPRPPEPGALTDSIDRLLARPQLVGAQVGAHVVRLADGKTLYAHQAERLLVPASNQKLFTTAAAVRVLGADYEFRTRVGLAGADLVVIGGGDPAIGGRFTSGDPTTYLHRWAQLLKEQRISDISGDLVVDDSFFDHQFVHPHWPANDLGHWYAAPVAALSLNDNCVDVRIAPGRKSDEPAHVELAPAGGYFKIDNRTRTVASIKEHAPRVTRRPGSPVIQCDGGVYLKAKPLTSWVTIDDPPLYFAQVFRDVLAQEGVKITGGVRYEPGIGRSGTFRTRVLHRFPLLPVLAVTNKESQNFYAEQLLKTLGAEQGDGSWNGGLRVIRHALDELGIDPASYVLDDGCGLSRGNRASASGFTALLAAIERNSQGELFRQTLAVAGEEGTLSHRLAEPDYRGRVWAKTGSIQGVRAISGYVQTRTSQWLAFSFLVNNPRQSVRAIQDDFCKALVDYGG